MLYTSEQVFFQWLLRIYVWLLAKAYGLNKLQTGEIKMNYIVKDDNPDVGFSVTVGDVTDSEGQVIPDAQLTFEIAAVNPPDGPEVLAVAINEDGKSGTVHFGAPGVAAFAVQVKDQNGNVLGSGSDGFTVTTGDPASISGVSTNFEGLTPVSEPTPTGGDTGTGGPTEGGV
jgi:hypothetical protein